MTPLVSQRQSKHEFRKVRTLGVRYHYNYAIDVPYSRWRLHDIGCVVCSDGNFGANAQEGTDGGRGPAGYQTDCTSSSFEFHEVALSLLLIIRMSNRKK